MPTDFVVSVDVARPLALLKNGERMLAYAFVNSLNKTAKEIQAEQRASVQRTFTVRKTDFIMREAAIISFASLTKQRFEASVRVGQKPRLLLSRFEKGGARGGFVGKSVAVPVVGGARPTKQSAIPREFTFAGMGLKAYRGGRRLTRKARGKHVRSFGTFAEFGRLSLPEPGAAVQWKGTSRTYLVPGVGVFQRTGPRSSRLLWAFHPSVRLLPQLRFIATGAAVAHRSFQRHLRFEVRRAFTRNLGPVAGALAGAI